MSETQHILDAIDGALLDYSVSGDAMRWTPEPETARSPVRPGYMIVDLTPEEVAEVMRRLGESIQPMIEAFRGMGEALTEAAPKFGAALVEAGIHPEQPPTDPRQRALWLARHRNTGPSRDVVHQRRPRAIQ